MSPNYETLGAGDTAKAVNQFSGDYLPAGQAGTSIIRYVFFDTGGDTAAVNVHYITTIPSGIATITNQDINFSAPYPNPSSGCVNFTYNLGSSFRIAQIKIYNIVGECIETIALSPLQNKVSVYIQAMPAGIYICKLEIDGVQSISQKLIVTH